MLNGIFINQNVCSIYVPAREDPCPVRTDLFYLAVGFTVIYFTI